MDEAESGRVADRPQFREMIEEGSKPNAPFEVILVWKFSRFTRKREHAVAFKSMLRRKGIRVVSITEHADDSPTGKLMEAIIESVDGVLRRKSCPGRRPGYEGFRITRILPGSQGPLRLHPRQGQRRGERASHAGG